MSLIKYSHLICEDEHTIQIGEGIIDFVVIKGREDS